ncbi:uncharacterized protein EV422DRAFT_123758 [Fimicolochytrium jonesii]|uniref:uncharacterized protein n=1 Tax=Fimicolochytrium jonesii TaxID=1396493 RepID=UPI0022FF2A6D|nr:uncharacterized protein EV422DRAFT_123758 [Fimicolochytrium jonesii]KAI8818881.1 hypothetical protein EV422DRAFT_123758 [Fimicolochytrium jonesii]
MLGVVALVARPTGRTVGARCSGSSQTAGRKARFQGQRCRVGLCSSHRISGPLLPTQETQGLFRNCQPFALNLPFCEGMLARILSIGQRWDPGWDLASSEVADGSAVKRQPHAVPHRRKPSKDVMLRVDRSSKLSNSSLARSPRTHQHRHSPRKVGAPHYKQCLESLASEECLESVASPVQKYSARSMIVWRTSSSVQTCQALRRQALRRQALTRQVYGPEYHPTTATPATAKKSSRPS